MPDLSLFKPLCDELDITINELLTGKVIVGLEIIKFKMPISLVFLVNTGILLSGLIILKYVMKLKLLLLLIISLIIVFLLLIAYKENKKRKFSFFYYRYYFTPISNIKNQKISINSIYML